MYGRPFSFSPVTVYKTASIIPRLHDPVVQPVLQPAVSCKQTSNRLSNRVVCLHDTAGCQTGLYNRFDNRVPGLTTVFNGQTHVRLSTVLTTGWMFVYTIQPVVKPVWQPDWQPFWQQVVSCKRGFTLTGYKQQSMRLKCNSCIYFEYEVYLLNYTLIIKT